MAWRIGPRWVRANERRVINSFGANHVTTTTDAVTAAAMARNVASLVASRTQLVTTPSTWQQELWDYYETCGEYGLAVTWRSNMISRVRLRAAEIRPGMDEPTIVDSGPAADLVDELFGDPGTQSEAMATLSTYLDIPGEGFMVGERSGGKQVWRTYSSDEIRARGNLGYEVIDETSTPGRVKWRDLSGNSLIVRVWRPHKRLRYMPYSPGKAARSAIRELELVNRHIQAQYLSRLASAGMIVLPDEVTFPVRDEFDDAPDPFMAEWIAAARQAIETPGTAAAVVPIPMRVPAEYVDKVQHIDFTLKIDDKIIEKRESARRRLAGIINVPTELLFDAGSINHWGLWQLEESGVKTYITPDVELITGALTTGYLRPRLLTQGEEPRRWVMWYDASEIVSRPDVTDNVIKAYDRLEVTGKVLRRTIGLGEDDKPTNAELQDLALKKLAINPTVGFLALHELTGLEVDVPTTSTNASGRGTSDDDRKPVTNEQEGPADGPPDTGEDQPRRPRGAATSERTTFAILQASSQHVIEFNREGYTLRHPLLCAPHLASCPFAHATHGGVPIRPGTTGNYECYLSNEGFLAVGRRTHPSADSLISDPPRRVNGVRLPVG
jgi:hypothetical protein